MRHDEHVSVLEDPRANVPPPPIGDVVLIVIELLTSDPLPTLVIVLLAPEIVLLVIVAVVSVPSTVDVASGNVHVRADVADVASVAEAVPPALRRSRVPSTKVLTPEIVCAVFVVSHVGQARLSVPPRETLASLVIGSDALSEIELLDKAALGTLP